METGKERMWHREQKIKSFRAILVISVLTLLSWTHRLLGDSCFVNVVSAKRRPCASTSLTTKAADFDVPVSEDWADEEDIDSDLAIPTLSRSALKLKPAETPEELDVDAVTAFVRQELGNTVFKASEVEDVEDVEDVGVGVGREIDLKSGASVLQRWALTKEAPEVAKEELIGAIEFALDRDVAEPHVLTSLMWSCGKLKVDDIAPILAPLRDRLPEVVNSMNAQNLTTFWCSVAKIQEFAEEVDDMIPVLLDAAIEKASDLRPNQVAAFVWASGKLDLRKAEVDLIKENFATRLSRNDLQSLPLKDIANFAFGLAQLDVRDTAILNSIAKATTEMAQSCKLKPALQDLPMIVMSLTRLGHKETSMNELLDAVASRLQRKRVLKKMRPWNLAALYWAWPRDGSLEGVRDMQGLLYAEVEDRLAKKQFTSRMLERSWMGPGTWKQRIDTSFKIPA